MKTIALTLGAAAIAAAALLAQEGAAPQSMKGVVQKKLAPVSTEVLHVQLPKPFERKLKNDASVLIIEKHKLPTVHLEWLLPASSLNEPEDLPGLADCTAEMLRTGAGKRNAKEIAEALSELGATLNISAEYGAAGTRVVATTLSENLDPLLDIMADVLLRPTFPQDELDKWKTRQLSRLQAMRANENYLGQERLRDVLYASDKRRMDLATPESVKKITREDVVKFYKANYRPGGALLGATGDITAAALIDKLESRFAAWEPGSVAGPKPALEAALPDKRVYLVNRPHSVQTLLLLSNRAIGRTDPDYIAVQVMNRVLGGGPAARLFRNIREDKGYTYGVSSGFTALRYLNHFNASSSVRTEVTGPALDEFFNEFRDIRERAVPAEELENAKRALVANFALSLDNQAGVLRQLMTVREFGLPANYWDTYPAKIMAVTAEDVQRVAKKYVPFENVQIIAVGDAGKIRDVLAKHGPVEEYDAEGVRVTR